MSGVTNPAATFGLSLSFLLLSGMELSVKVNCYYSEIARPLWKTLEGILTLSRLRFLQTYCNIGEGAGGRCGPPNSF